MAKRRKGKSETKRKKAKKLNVIVTVLIVISILLGVIIFLKEGILGKSLGPILGGVLGYIKYLLPFGLFFMALYIAHEKDTKYYGGKIAMLLTILLMVDVILATYQFSIGNIDSNASTEVVLSKSFDLGKIDLGGGVLGTFVASLLIKFLGTTGTVIASIGICIVLLVLMFSLRPAEVISNSLDKMQEIKEQKRKEKENEKNSIREEIPRETWFQRKMREKQERETEKKRAMQPLEDQITINLNKQTKKYDHSNDGLDVPNFKGISKASPTSANVTSGSEKDDLFTQKDIQKEEKKQEVLQLEHGTLVSEEQKYEFPPIELLSKVANGEDGNSKKSLLITAEKLRRTLYSFGVSAKVENVSVGPAITRYELAPAEGVRVSKIANLADDIALSLEAETIRIEAPIPGKHTVGIEVPNKAKTIVALRDIIESDTFVNSKSKLAFALGKDVAGEIEVTDIAKMPHLLIAGSTGSGKSVCINTLVTSIVYKAKPSEVKLLMVDPKVVELSVYNGIPHLLIPVVTDAKKAAGALSWAVQEMAKRYSLFAQKNVRDIKGYNEAAQSAGEATLPQIVIIIDELADLMMVAAKEVEDAICRLAQMARAAGMHLVIATQRPSVDVITGIIKANIPSRIAFAVSSQVDSRTILDGAGAEKLLGKGDMLFYPSGAPKPVRIQGAFVSDKEVENIVKFIKREGVPHYDENIIKTIDNADEPSKVNGDKEDEDDTTDPLLDEAIEMVIETRTASASFIQRRFKVGYARAGRIIDQMEDRGIVSGYQGSKPREVLMSKERWQELKMAPSQEPEENNDEDQNS